MAADCRLLQNAAPAIYCAGDQRDIEAFYLLEREFADAMLGRAAPAQLGVKNLRTLEATFFAYQAAADDTPVRLTWLRD